MKRYVLVLLALCAVLLPAGYALAQSSGGQICVRAYEDRNGNQSQDVNEPFITGNISASLADVEGVIIQSLLMNDSPRSPQGMLCFQGLAAGQYTMTITSADYVATTPNTFVTSINETTVPVPYDFGGKQLVSAAVPVQQQSGTFNMTPAQQKALLEKVFLASIGAAVAVGLMIVIGAVLYFLFFRVPAPIRSTGQMYAVTGTGQYQAVNPTSTGQYPAAHSTGSYPAATPATPGSPMRPVDPSTGQLRYQPQQTPVAPSVPLRPDQILLDDTGPSRPITVVDESPINPDDDTGKFRPPADDIPG